MSPDAKERSLNHINETIEYYRNKARKHYNTYIQLQEYNGAPALQKHHQDNAAYYYNAAAGQLEVFFYLKNRD